jgi:hypothetical protein
MTATTLLTPCSTADYIAMPEDDYNDLIRAREAISAVAYLCLEVANKASHHPSKDGFMTLPATDMSSLLLCISDSMQKDSCQSMSKFLSLQTDQMSKA